MGVIERVMIGDYNLRVRFNGLTGFITCFMELITLRAELFSHMNILAIVCYSS